SREFEREADAHAVEQLRRAGIPPARLASMLERLASTHLEIDSRALGYLSTHPPTPERIQAINGEPGSR
ncbi:MAG: M48 family metalloprotease, partial [Opitutaceae bacterium]